MELNEVIKNFIEGTMNEETLTQSYWDKQIYHEQGLKEGENIGLKKGQKLGIAKGRNIGLAEGKNIGITEVAKNMLAKNEDVSYVSEITGLSKNKVLKLKRSL